MAATKQLGTQLIFVLYDGIGNSVFESQVRAPLIKQLNNTSTLHATIVAFEYERPSQITLNELATHPRLRIKIESKFRFWGQWALWPCAIKLKSFLAKFDRHELIARGPFAGWLCKQAITSNCSKLTIQARGLAAQEYAYAYPKGACARLRSWQYAQLEKKVYTQCTDRRITIQAVSPALKQFLIDEYDILPKKISIAHKDIPPAIAADQIAHWRTQIRAQLQIPADARVYCYNGSAKPWQCPQETIAYFKAQHAHNPHAILLVLTRDSAIFAHLLAQLPSDCYRICSVPHEQVYAYLAAADIGLLFRTPHIVNWTSRPTKALEYRAVGLQIIHNRTIAFLCNT